MRTSRSVVALAVMFAAGYAAGQFTRVDAAAQAAPRVFEMRTYYTYPGKLGDLNTRFRDHTLRLFEKHGMTNVGYWVPQDEPAHGNTLVYVIAHASREQARKNWAAFGADPDWVKAKTASEVNGRIVEKVDSVFMDAIDYSPIK
ncbi:MAG: NIPSNAP family protein [Acidobacteria bacterium]|nr:NIPSNAP family protein [Acidobacteriota bacterium]